MNDKAVTGRISSVTSPTTPTQTVSTQSESDSSSYGVHNWYRTTNMSSPYRPTQDEILQIILFKLTNLEVGMSKLSIENVHRIEEIVQLGNRIGISARVSTTVGPLIQEKRGTNYNGCYQEVVALLSLPMLFLNCCNHGNHIIAS